MINPFKKADIDREKKSSGIFQKMEDIKKVINRRVLITMYVVVAMFAVIIFRLIDLQIIEHETYSEKLESYTTLTQSFSSPRGTIYDSEGNVLVESVSSLTIAYYPPTDITEAEEWELAEKLVDELGLEASEITTRQLKDMYIKYMSDVEDDDLLDLLSDEQLEAYENGEADYDDDVYDWLLEAIDVSDLDERTQAIYEIRMNMEDEPDDEYKTIVEDASEEQVAYLAENSSNFPGFKILFDWKRSYTSAGTALKSVLGSVSTSTQGLPSEYSEYYLALGYELNDRVGTSGLEYTYESYLSGSDSVYEINFNEDGIAYLTQIETGKSGYDLTLTINSEYQETLTEYLIETIEDWQDTSEYLENIYLVVVNPNTGGILAMCAVTMDEESGEAYSNPTATYTDANVVGSVVKPATLYMGLNEGVVEEGEEIYDTPLSLKDTPEFASYHNYGWLSDVEAIQKSSNVYMATIAIRLTGTDYVEGMSLSGDSSIFSLMRRYYNSFGLGVLTGIDLPNEAVGYIGDDTEIGKILYYAIGQYDSYTTMQLAQYVSTIANGGSRVQLHLLDYVSEVNDSDTYIYKFKTNVLGTLYGDTDYLARSTEGMELCVSSGYCGSVLTESNLGYSVAAKTGTAEVGQTVDGEYIEMSNSAMIAYTPTEDAEIALACMAPYANYTDSNICSSIVAYAITEYYENYSD